MDQVILTLKKIHDYYEEEINTPDTFEEVPTDFPTLYEDNFSRTFLIETGDGINPMKIQHFIHILKYYSSDDREE